jgi:DinB superfamily
MNSKIEKIRKFREFLLAQIADLTPDQLNKIPEGYNNNIIWNLTHLICAQQSICYLRAGQPITVKDIYFTPFLTNTKPDRFIDSQEIDEIKKLFVSSIDEFQIDIDKRLFDNYTASPNILKIYGVELNTIDDALDFILYHEGFHSGYIVSLKHLVK